MDMRLVEILKRNSKPIKTMVVMQEKEIEAIMVVFENFLLWAFDNCFVCEKYIKLKKLVMPKYII